MLRLLLKRLKGIEDEMKAINRKMDRAVPEKN